MLGKRAKAIGRAYGMVWTPERCDIIQIHARTQKAKHGIGTVFVEGEIGEDFLHAVGIACQLLGDCKELDVSHTNIFLSIPCPVDGDSAGLPIFLAMYSAITRKPINQKLGFTGALNEQGCLLPIGSLEEKLLAAHRAKLEGVVLPMDNLADLPKDSDNTQWRGMVICPALRVMDALVLANP